MKTTKWLGYDFFNDGLSNTRENYSDAAAQFRRDVRSDIRKMVKGTDWVLHSLNTCNNYDFSGFLRNVKKDKFVYFSCTDIRFWEDDWYNNLLIRTAKHDKDWTGGRNNYCTFPVLIHSADQLMSGAFSS